MMKKELINRYPFQIPCLGDGKSLVTLQHFAFTIRLSLLHDFKIIYGKGVQKIEIE